jgi:hypothetical protein
MPHFSRQQVLFIVGRYDELAAEWNEELTSERPNWCRLAELDDQMHFIEVLWEISH